MDPEQSRPPEQADPLAERWRQARTNKERREVIATALGLGTVEAAARALEFSRRHFTRLRKALDAPATPASVARETSCLPAAPTHGGTRSAEDSLTCGEGAPTFLPSRTLASAAEDPAQQEEMVKVTLDLPAEDKEWLEDEAMKEKRRHGRSRPSMSRVVHRLIAEERARRALRREERQGGNS